jgi:hypothetical protein
MRRKPRNASPVPQVRAVFAAICLLSFPSCSKDETAAADAGIDAGTVADAGPDSGAEADAGAVCTFDLAPEGGEISACGLHVWAPAGAVAEAEEIKVVRSASGASVPAGLALESPVLTLQPADTDLALLAYLVVHFPQSNGGTGVWAAKEFPEYGAWGVLETCYADASWGGVRTTSLGTFTVLTDVAGNDAPSSGSGEGSWGGQDHALDFSGIGHAHYVPLPDGGKSVDLYGYDSENTITLKIDFAIGDGGYAGEGIVTALDGWEAWPDLTPDPGVSLTVAQPEADHLVGEMTGNMYRWSDTDTDWVATDMTGSFDVQMARHFVGADDPCPIPPMDGE